MFASDQYGGREFLTAFINPTQCISLVVIDAKNNLFKLKQSSYWGIIYENLAW